MKEENMGIHKVEGWKGQIEHCKKKKKKKCSAKGKRKMH